MAGSPVVLPDDLIAEVVSFLPVIFLLRFRSVSKSWKILISNPSFVKLHLKISATQNPHFTVITAYVKHHLRGYTEVDYSVVPYPMSCLIENPTETFPIPVDPYCFVSDKECCAIVGTCNGLICLSGDNYNRTDDYIECWLRLWNPATRTTSSKFGQFGEFGKTLRPHGMFNFKFGCDDSTGTYKVVAFRYDYTQLRSVVKIINFGDNVWRDIESFPVDPLDVDSIWGDYCPDNGVYLSGTLNWLAIHNNLDYDFEDITVGQFVIVSLDWRTETYNQYKLPRGFDEVPSKQPTVGVLGGCLCFSYLYKKTNFDFVVWQMKKFGVEESWAQLFKINYQIPSDEGFIAEDAIKYSQMIPLLLTKDGSVLIRLRIKQHKYASLYNWRENRKDEIEFTASRPITNNNITREDVRWCWAMDYVESLVSIF
jgi:F-box interacting protein